MSVLRKVATLIGFGPMLWTLLVWWPGVGAAGAGPDSAPATPSARPVDREAWARRLTGLSEADWRTSFNVGQELATLPGDEGFAILSENWERIDNAETRQQLLKAWKFSRHPRLIDGLDLGMRDRSPAVQKWAILYLNDIALQDFAEDFQAYRAWYQANRQKPVPEVIAQSVRKLTAEVARSAKEDAPRQARRLVKHANVFQQVPQARRAAVDAGLMPILDRWATAGKAGASDSEIRLAVDALQVMGLLKPGEVELQRLVLPALSKERPVEVRSAAAGALEGKENGWALDRLLQELKEVVEADGKVDRRFVWASSQTLASLDDPRAIPTMIALIEADNTYDTVYGIGYFGLGSLTGVAYDESHDGAWWRGWWTKNHGRFPKAVRDLEIPKLPKKQKRPVAEQESAVDPLADVAAIQSQDLRAGHDENKRYFLIGAKETAPPTAGYGLLIVLPGGDGSADFNPFIRRLHKHVLNNRWLIAQAVAPKWDQNQFNQVVWPTSTHPYPTAKFTTEEFIRAILEDVRTKVKLAPDKVILLGWSSGGPPCYEMAKLKDSGVRGAFIAMSVFRPEQVPTPEDAKNKAFYLLQSPQDQVTPIQHAEAAEKALQAIGAKVHLRRYDGGHGWRGDIWGMIGEGIGWLDRQVETE